MMNINVLLFTFLSIISRQFLVVAQEPACGSNCADCSIAGAGKCDRCNTGYTLISATGTCIPCASNCAICSLAECNFCNTGYTLNSATGACDPCGSNCRSCSNAGVGKCDLCNTGYTLNSATGACDRECVKVGWSGYFNTTVVKEGQLLSSVSELSQCKQACIDDTTCAGFDFNYVDNRCWTFSLSCNTSERETRDGFLHYDINRCLTGPTDCRLTDTGDEYIGTLNVAQSGAKCRRWDAHPDFATDWIYYGQSIFAFPDGDIHDANDYCRNPQGGWGWVDQPYCHIEEGSFAWEYCSVPHCDL